MNPVIAGAIGGFVGTVPMTAVMELGHRALPERERYPLHPRLITTRLAHDAGMVGQLDDNDWARVSLGAHFAYGAAMGALYGAVAGLPGPAGLKGLVHGLGVWGGNYLGLLPALGILSPATEHPPRRTAVMIAAHLVWGAVVGAVVERLTTTTE